MKTVLCAALAAGACVVTAQPLVSLFDSSVEGWGVETRSDPAGSFSPVATYTPDFIASGGDAGGHIFEIDPDGNWSFFTAPGAWLGDRSAFFGRVLRYSTRTDAVSFPDGRLVVLIGDGGRMLSHDAGVPPPDTWTRRSVRLGEGSWFIGADASGAAATGAEIEAVLGELEALLIGLEFGADAAEERVGLDRVALGVCAADLETPFGLLDLADITAFVTAFGAGEPAADIDGNGLFDLADITAFVEDFTGGCP
jgi:hypothetical protein